MSLKRYKPTTPGRRHSSVLKCEKLGEQKIVRSLVSNLKKNSGRNSSGKITVRHQGGRHKRYYRTIDFSKPILDKPGKVIGIQYDPNRSAPIALLVYENGEKVYTIAVAGISVGDKVVATRSGQIDIRPGNRMPLKNIPAGTLISNIELYPERSAKVVRSAGSSASVLSSDEKFVQIKMPSGEIRKFSSNCLATVGRVGNTESSLVRLGKAGRMRHRGVRPTVRGKAMNPVDHPHGGGEGHNPIGLKHPKTRSGKPAFGVITRKRQKTSDSLIIRRRVRRK
jgi:large subunit ribosomal protein L2